MFDVNKRKGMMKMNGKQFYLNEEQMKLFQALLDYPSLQAMHEVEDSERVLLEIREKANKKRIDKKAQLPSDSFTDKNGNELFFSPGPDNGAIMLTVDKSSYKKRREQNNFSFDWDYSTVVGIANYLHTYAIFTGDDEYKVYSHPYSEEFNVFRDEAERSISFSADSLSFLCYTDDENDDNWTYFVPWNVKEVLRTIVSYLFKDETQYKFYKDKLLPEINSKYEKWLSKK